MALLHARNLIDFFWPQTNRRRPHPDGIYALHYVAPWPGNRQLPQRPNELYDALSAQLAHVSVLRTRADTIRNLEQEIHGLGQDLDRHWTEWQRALTGSQWLPLLNEAEADWNARIQ